MSRPKGSTSRPGAGRSTGRPPTFGHRKGTLQLRRGEELTGPFALDRRELELLYETGGPARIQRELLLDHLEVRARFKLVLEFIESKLEKGEATHSTYNEYVRTYDRLTKTASGIADVLSEQEKSVIDGVLDYEQVLEAQRAKD